VTGFVSDAADRDEALMAEVREGDVQAFQTLYARHHRAVFAFALRSLGDRGEAEEVLQETFLRVYTGRRQYRPLAAFRTWLFTIARHQVIDQVRKRRAQPPLETEDSLEPVAHPTASPLQEMEAQELSDRVGRALACLPSSRREVVLLSRVAGLTHEEVARVTGQSPAAVRVALHRALRDLQALLARP
jgi:RNA polymerase sigma-70 factor (ECF subfamily)